MSPLRASVSHLGTLSRIAFKKICQLHFPEAFFSREIVPRPDNREHMPIATAVSGNPKNQALHPVYGCRQMYSFHGFNLVVPTNRANGWGFHNAVMLVLPQPRVGDGGHVLRL